MASLLPHLRRIVSHPLVEHARIDGWCGRTIIDAGCGAQPLQLLRHPLALQPSDVELREHLHREIDQEHPLGWSSQHQASDDDHDRDYAAFDGELDGSTVEGGVAVVDELRSQVRVPSYLLAVWTVGIG